MAVQLPLGLDVQSSRMTALASAAGRSKLHGSAPQRFLPECRGDVRGKEMGRHTEGGG